ncbi:hypothetical protein SI65_05439 [Aspergillus cristatus]|uniref:DUF7492 domain-containing protein n=1 Tax=Aspergillus cristatus TaxID=573508 RepID=A0A1E3BCX6_ASPCR|nr:hypothetical protein SI65_05439 [Aspergillus cristatus]
MHIPTSWKVLTTLLATTANAHSWIEQLMVINPNNGSFVGSPGYPRGYVPRTSPDFSDDAMTYRLPSNGVNLTKADKMCMDTQTSPDDQKPDFPRLQAQQGSAIALRYQENGHVTEPENQEGKPPNRGTVYVYGTTEPSDDDRIISIHKVWNEDGTGGDKRGKLLATRNYDDGRCYQVNGGTISTDRQAKFKHTADQLMGTNLWCQTDIKLPEDAEGGKQYTLYWVWDWPTLPGKDDSLPNGKPELYTTCMDVDVTGKADTNTKVQAKYDDTQSLNDASIPGQFAKLFSPGSGSGSASGSASQGAASSSVAQSSAIPANSAVGASSAAAPSAQPSSSSPVLPASSAAAPSAQPSTDLPVPQAAASSAAALSVNLFNSPDHPTTSSAAISAARSSSPAMFAARPSRDPAMFAAPSASSSVLNKYQQTGPSFVTRTKTVHQTHCPDA